MRLIDSVALVEEMYHKSFEVDDGRNVWKSGLWIRYQIFEEAIRNAPIVDAVPIIRCADCKFYTRGNTKGYCYFDDDCYVWYDNDFCSRAERKEES